MCRVPSRIELFFRRGALAVAKSRDKKSKSKPASKPKAKSSNHQPRATTGMSSSHKENEAQIAVHWKEEELFHPSTKLIAQANLSDPSMVESFSEKHFPDCFRAYAE